MKDYQMNLFPDCQTSTSILSTDFFLIFHICDFYSAHPVPPMNNFPRRGGGRGGGRGGRGGYRRGGSSGSLDGSGGGDGSGRDFRQFNPNGFQGNGRAADGDNGNGQSRGRGERGGRGGITSGDFRINFPM